MSTKKVTQTDVAVLGSLQRLHSKLEANSADLVHLEGSRVKLGTVLTRLDELSKQQGAMTASKQAATKEKQSLLIGGKRLGTGLRAMVREHYGPRAEKLAEFDMQPFRGRKAKAPAAETPDTPATTTPAAAKD
ncbi:MAG: hypothetical protein WAM82_16140 [Thermoanaerobaculia bacterium]